MKKVFLDKRLLMKKLILITKIIYEHEELNLKLYVKINLNNDRKSPEIYIKYVGILKLFIKSFFLF